MSELEYLEMWQNFIEENSNNLNIRNVWEFQKSILSDLEIEFALHSMLIISDNDPRKIVLDTAEQLYKHLLILERLLGKKCQLTIKN